MEDDIESGMVIDSSLCCDYTLEKNRNSLSKVINGDALTMLYSIATAELMDPNSRQQQQEYSEQVKEDKIRKSNAYLVLKENGKAEEDELQRIQNTSPLTKEEEVIVEDDIEKVKEGKVGMNLNEFKRRKKTPSRVKRESFESSGKIDLPMESKLEEQKDSDVVKAEEFRKGDDQKESSTEVEIKAETSVQESGEVVERRIERRKGRSSRSKVENEYCLCGKNWKGNEFMVGCDGICGRWFHPRCIKLSKSEMNVLKSDKDSILLCDECNNTDEKRFVVRSKDLYCVCQVEWQSDQRFMVGCEGKHCDQWFHPSCIGLTEVQCAKKNVIFFCKDCDKDGKYSISYGKHYKENEKAKGESELTYCVCNSVWQNDRFMLGCESIGCENWYHPECIQISMKKLKSNPNAMFFCNECDPSATFNVVVPSLRGVASTLLKSDEEELNGAVREEDEKETKIDVKSGEEIPVDWLCICGKQRTSNPCMIGCENVGCDRWFHPDCVHISYEDAIHPSAHFYCDQCSESGTFQLLEGNGKQQTRKKSRVDYVSLNVGHFSIKDHQLAKKGSIGFRQFLSEYCFESDERFLRKNGNEIRKGLVEEYGLNEPILIGNPKGLGLKIPKCEEITVDRIGKAVGYSRLVDVIDVETQSELVPQWTLGDWCQYYNRKQHSKNTDERILNVISLEISHTELGEMIEAPQIVRDIGWVEQCWPKSSLVNSLLNTKLNPFAKQQHPKVQLYALMSIADAFTDFHIDFGGSSVWYHLIKGKKVFYFIEPTASNLRKFLEWSNSPLQNTVFFADEVELCYKVELNQGQTMIIPSGWIHAVYTAQDSIVFGGNFLHIFSFEMQFKVFDIERNSHVSGKYHFPFFAELHVYVMEAYACRMEKLGEKYIEKLGENEKRAIIKLRKYLERELKSKQNSHRMNSSTTWMKISPHLQSRLISALESIKAIDLR